MMLSENFTVAEFEKSDTAIRLGIDNAMPAWAFENALHLAEAVMQPARDKFGPIVVRSGFRNEQVNKVIGGSDNSQHMRGEAVDFETLGGASNVELAEWIRDNCEFDQLILEFFTPGDPYSGWVHVSASREKNRGEVLTARRVKRNGKYVTEYVTGIDIA